MRSALKRPVERALASSAVTRWTRQRLRDKRLILAYHGIIPDGASAAGQRTLFITQRDFSAQLDMLSEFVDVAPLDEIDGQGDGRPRVAITLDDAYRGAVCEGVHELAKRSLPATLFVAPGRLDRHVFWWDALSSGTGMLDDSLREYALSILSGRDERVRAWAAAAAVPSVAELPVYARAATLDELRDAVSRSGITVGSHTWSHANLSKLSITETLSEIGRARSWLKMEFGEKAIDWLAYPYGLDSVGAHHALADASYSGGLRITGGWHRRSPVAQFARPRLNVPAGLSVAGLKARVLGGVPC
jgi:peptidoglycan/xylan/chitin deacetylase (PgdA/CDA1 family)